MASWVPVLFHQKSWLGFGKERIELMVPKGALVGCPPWYSVVQSLRLVSGAGISAENEVAVVEASVLEEEEDEYPV